MEDEDMEVELVFEAREIDPDYEFDAAMFFDFTHEESLADARKAERWFESALSYPASPFVAKLLLREESIFEGINHSTNDEVVEDQEAVIDVECGGGQGPEVSLLEMDIGGYNLRSKFRPKAKVNSSAKPNFPRSSTLMKPTASILAKQYRAPQVARSRFQMLFAQKDRSLGLSSLVESHAAKRQKLDGGLLCKVGDIKQQTDFFHKAPNKDGNFEKATSFAKLRLTIPREPELETAQRAQRMRPKSNAIQDQVTVRAQNFKARPLNRKILKAPSLSLPKKSTPKLPEFQEFHLKTLERAMQHSSGVSSSSIQLNDSYKGLDKHGVVAVAANGKSNPRRVPTIKSSTTDAPKQDAFSTTHLFSARPLNKKILSSKGDLGVFRNGKREPTVPVEVKLQTDKKDQHKPPVELFNKLSLTSEVQPNSGSQLQLPRPSCISLKGSKENILNTLQTDNKLGKERPSLFSGKQIQCGSNEAINEVGNQFSMRSLGIR
ncbi:hypothetical protein K2173_018182 [Erythroxylum novogranatense]|uniref:TPX2 central domain-containing protein n=1 Tax=Erythroxylum novogranatense TaxID=1862640 RepID=A0AAV8TNZ0_9ROSI|nr:hypothetical protein K2173_018182 [Erythroxylum novogranatense]